MGKKKQFEVAESAPELCFERTYVQLFNLYRNIFTNIFHWGGDLPDGLMSGYIENKLYTVGALTYFEDKKYGPLMLPFARDGNLNIYGHSQTWTAIGIGKQFPGLNYDNAVIIRNNYYMIPTIEWVVEWLADMADVKQMLRVNRNACKTPVVFYGTQEECLAYKNACRKARANEPAIIIDKRIDGTAQYGLSAEYAPYMGDELFRTYRNYMGELFNLVGTQTVPYEKTERQNEKEITGNTAVVADNFSPFYFYRQKGIEEIREKFGRELTCEIENPITKDMIDGIFDKGTDSEDKQNAKRD